MAEDGAETQVTCDFCKKPRIQVGELTCRHRMCPNCFPFYSNKLDKCYICVLAAAEVKRARMKIIKGSVEEEDIRTEEEKFFCPNYYCSFVGTLPILFAHKIGCNMRRPIVPNREKMSDVLTFFGKRHTLRTSVFVEILKDVMKSELNDGRHTFSAEKLHALTLHSWRLAEETLCNEGVQSDQQEIERDEQLKPEGLTTEGSDRGDHAAESSDSKNVALFGETLDVADVEHCKAEPFDDWNSEESNADSDSFSLVSEERELVDEALLNSATPSHGEPGGNDSSSEEFEGKREDLGESDGSIERRTPPLSKQRCPRNPSRSAFGPVVSTLLVASGILCALFLLLGYGLDDERHSETRIRGQTLRIVHNGWPARAVSELVTESQFKNHAIRFLGTMKTSKYEARLALGASRQNGTNVLWVAASLINLSDEENYMVELRIQHKYDPFSRTCTFLPDERGVQERWPMNHRGFRRPRHMEQHITKHLRMMRFTDFLSYDDATDEGYIVNDSMEIAMKVELL